MRKAFLIVLCFVILLSSFIFTAYAQGINSYFPRPEPKYQVINGKIHIEIYWVLYQSNIYHFIELKADYPTNTHFYVKGNTPGSSMYRTDNQPTSGTINYYNLTTGSLIMTENADGVRFNETIGDLNAPNYFKWVNNTVDNGFYPDNANFTIETQGNTAYEINWAAEIPTPKQYRSFVSEPFSDDYNKYFILAGSNNQYLYHVSLLISEYDFIQTMWASDPGNAYQFQLKDILYPELQLDDIGFELYIELDQNWLSFITLNQQDIALYYDVQVTCYKLSDGQFVDSYLYSNLSIVQNHIKIQYDFDIPDFFDSIKVYGVFYKDQSTQRHLNMLSCVWADDPQFSAWQTSVKNYLRDIYNILNQQGESVTIAQDPQGFEDMEAAGDQLKVTNSNGQPVNQVQQVENAFSEAAVGINQLNVPIQSINSLITRLFNTHSIVLIPIIVALALGLVVTLLGKDKSD